MSAANTTPTIIPVWLGGAGVISISRNLLLPSLVVSLRAAGETDGDGATAGLVEGLGDTDGVTEGEELDEAVEVTEGEELGEGLGVMEGEELGEGDGGGGTAALPTTQNATGELLVAGLKVMALPTEDMLDVQLKFTTAELTV